MEFNILNLSSKHGKSLKQEIKTAGQKTWRLTSRACERSRAVDISACRLCICQSLPAPLTRSAAKILNTFKAVDIREEVLRLFTGKGRFVRITKKAPKSKIPTPEEEETKNAL